MRQREWEIANQDGCKALDVEMTGGGERSAFSLSLRAIDQWDVGKLTALSLTVAKALKEIEERPPV